LTLTSCQPGGTFIVREKYCVIIWNNIQLGNTGHTRRRKTEQKHNTICVGYHYAQTNKDKVNKTWAFLHLQNSLNLSLSYRNKHNLQEEFEDTKRVIRIRLLKKNRQHKGQQKKDKRTNNDSSISFNVKGVYYKP
jgi:hypothetical protein